MKESHPRTILQMRLLVGFLGERAQFAWWPTAFYEPSGRLFLEPVFAKTLRLTQYHGVLEAARRLHDEHLNVGSYHLFRLPEELEQDLHALLQTPAGEELASMAPQGKEAALDTLKRLSGKEGDGHDPVGPLAIGGIKHIDSIETLKLISEAYGSAFTRNTRVYPYLAP